MVRRIRHPSARPRRGAATAELALLLPFLGLLFVVCVDFARLFYYSLSLENCARNGAYFASDYPGIYAYGSASGAAQADASNLNPAPQVVTTYDSSYNGSYSQTTPISNGYVQVTVTWTFHTLTTYPLVPSSITLTRSARMRMAPITPTNFP